MVARGVKWPRGGTPVITPPGDHYQVSKNLLFSDPRVDAARWRLDVHGLVARPLSLSLDDLLAMPAVEQYATLACIGNGVPARAVGTALWTGVPLAAVLERAGVAGGAREVVLIGADNYTDSIPLERALQPGTLLAYRMNGEPVPRGHGSPLRAIVPGIYGMKNVKWIEAIEIVSGDYLGYWQQRGWSDAAPYQTFSRIDEPRHDETLAGNRTHRLLGIAFAGDRGISRVDVLIDGVAQPAQLEPALGANTWVRWSYDWSPTFPGEHTLAVRAHDGNGEAQLPQAKSAFPDGALGLHSIRVAIA